MEMTETGAELAPDAPLLPILIAPHKTLKSRARTVADADMDAVRALVPRMFATMYKAPGIGLAAPQVDVLLRLAVIDLGRRAPNGKALPGPGQPIVLINPTVIAVSGELATREEGCLSIPNQYAEVTRPAAVRIGYMDLDGARREIEAEDLLSACIQHEMDHLEGVLFVDHLSALKRNMIMRKLAKEQRHK